MARSLIPFLDAGYAAADPFVTLHREMNRLFDEALRGGTAARGGAIQAPRMNISETKDAIQIEAELPGVAESDVQIELTGDTLTIRGEKKAEREDKDYHIVERSYGSFARSVRLPFAAKPDQVGADFQNGVLIITVPKAAAQEQVHRIQVKSGQAAQIGGGAAPNNQTQIGQTQIEQTQGGGGKAA